MRPPMIAALLLLATSLFAAGADSWEREMIEVERAWNDSAKDEAAAREAKSRLAALEARDPTRVRLWLLWGRIGFATGSYEDAALGFSIANERGAEPERTRAPLARSLFEWGVQLAGGELEGKEKLLRILGRSLELIRDITADPDVERPVRVEYSRLELLCLANLATVHQWAGNLKEAEAIGAELVRRVPENPEYHLILARTYAAGLKWEEALAQMEAARARDPERDWSEVYPFLGRIHSHLGHAEEAERFFALFLAEHPDDVWALKQLGNHYFRAGQFGPAVEVFLRNIELTPRDKALHHRLSEALRRLGRFEEAEKHARIYHELDEDSQFLKPVRTGE